MSDKMRDEFKEWARSRGMSLPVNDDIHYNEWTQLAWEAWQASRASLVIELPEHFEYDNPGEAFPAIKDCRIAIEAAGLKVRN